MKTSMILLALLFSYGTYAAQKFRIIACQVKLDNELMDKTTFYLNLGQKVTSRMSILNGLDEIFLTIDHNMHGKSVISIRDYHSGVKSSRSQLNKHTEKVAMKAMKQKQVKMVFRPNTLKKEIQVFCQRIK